jgi:hypothetical protein
MACRKMNLAACAVALSLSVAGATAGTISQTNGMASVSYADVSAAVNADFESLPQSTGDGGSVLMSMNKLTIGERFSGQTLSVGGPRDEFDVLSGSPVGPLSLVAGKVGENLYVVPGGNRNALAGMGPIGSDPGQTPPAETVGEGAISFLFDIAQSEFGFKALATNVGNAWLSFFRADGSLIDTFSITGLENTGYGFKTASGKNEIYGVSIWNTDGGGFYVDDLKYITSIPVSVPVPEPIGLAMLALAVAAGVRMRGKLASKAG